MFCLFLEGILNRNLLGFGVCADLQNLNSVHFPSAISESFQGFIVCFRWFVLLDAIWSVDANCLNCRRYLWVCLNFPNSVHFPSAVSLILSKTSTRFIFRRRHPFSAYAAPAYSRGFCMLPSKIFIFLWGQLFVAGLAALQFWKSLCYQSHESVSQWICTFCIMHWTFFLRCIMDFVEKYVFSDFGSHCKKNREFAVSFCRRYPLITLCTFGDLWTKLRHLLKHAIFIFHKTPERYPHFGNILSVKYEPSCGRLCTFGEIWTKLRGGGSSI